MNTFTIDNETNNITFHTEPVEDTHSEEFQSAEELTALSATWSTARFIDIWNGLPGVTPVNKFKDRKTAVSRIWKAIQTLVEPARETIPEAAAEPEASVEAVTPAEVEAAVEPATSELEPNADAQAPDVAPGEATATKRASRKANAPTGETVVEALREKSKTSQVIAMLKREGGTTLEEIMTAMGWLKHTTRAMLSAGGSLTKKHGLVVTSEKVGDKRTYSIKA